MQAGERLAGAGIIALVFLIGILGQAVAAQGSQPLPKEAKALMPSSATDITGTWAAMATSVHGKISATVRGKAACEEATSEGTVTIEAHGSTMSHLVKM